jgi:DNA-binding transcriptional ArsR family regulator
MDAIQGLTHSKLETRHSTLSYVDKLRIGQSYRLLRDLRLPICKYIMRALIYDGPMHVTDIIGVVSRIAGMDIEQSVISLHLAILRRHRIITVQEDGRLHIYSIDLDRIRHINRALASFLGDEHTDILPGQRIGDS